MQILFHSIAVLELEHNGNSGGKLFPEFPHGRAIKTPNYNYKGTKSSETIQLKRPINTKPFIPSQPIESFMDGLPYIPFEQSNDGSSQNIQDQNIPAQPSYSTNNFDETKDSDSYDEKDSYNPSYAQNLYSGVLDDSSSMNQTDDLQESSAPYHSDDMSHTSNSETTNIDESKHSDFDPDAPYPHDFYSYYNYQPNDEGDSNIEEPPMDEFHSHKNIDEISFTTSRNFLPTLPEDPLHESNEHSTSPSSFNYGDIRFTPPSEMAEDYEDDPHGYNSYMSPNKEMQPTKSNDAHIKYHMNHSPTKPYYSYSENPSDFKIPYGKLKNINRPSKPEVPHFMEGPSEPEDTYGNFNVDSFNSRPEMFYGKFNMDTSATKAEIPKGKDNGNGNSSPPPYVYVDMTMKNPYMYKYEDHPPMKDTLDFHDIKYEEHDVEHTTPKPKEYHTFYYIGRKLWLVPLYAGLIFFIYVLALLLKHISRHKIAFPHKYYSHFNERQLSNDISTTDLVMKALQISEKLYSD
ncbi:hypothetical protein C0J52_16401 [Blattella germanica]|nr:hypothetical protein C0J52_16401 [Blattella germanica]